MKRVLAVLAILFLTTLPGFALAQRGAKPPMGGRGPRLEFLIGSITKLTTVTGGSTFVLQDGNNTVTIGVPTATPITNLSDDSKATLADGQVVHVSGNYDANTKMLAAISVVVDNRMIGTVSNLVITATGYTFDLTAGKNKPVSIVAAATAPVTKGSNRKATTTVAEGQQVLVTGASHATTGVVTATSIVVNDLLPPTSRFGALLGLTTTAAGSAFSLVDSKGVITPVATTPTTKLLLFSSNSATTLADGQNVFISGSYDATTKVLTATSVVVNDKKAPSANLSVTGVVTSVNAAADSFVVMLKSSNVSPTGTTVTVLVTPNTTYKVGPGKTAGISAVTVGAEVQAEGTFDATTQTFTATSVSIGK